MARAKPLEIFTPPNVLKVKLGAGPGTIDPNLVAKADNALTDLRKEFAVWLDEQAKALSAARDQLWTTGTAEAHADLLRWGVEIKGQGSTMSFPFVTRVASSMVRLVQACQQAGRPLPRSLIDAHVDSIRAAVRDSVTDPHDPLASALATQLEAHVSAAIKP